MFPAIVEGVCHRINRCHTFCKSVIRSGARFRTRDLFVAARYYWYDLVLASLTTGIAVLCMRGCASTIVFSVLSGQSVWGASAGCFGLGFPAWAVRSAAFASIGVSMFSSFASIGFCGSRSLPASAQPLVASVVSSVLSGSSARVVVGCSVGADALVLASVPPVSLFRVSVFASFGFGGRGACALSAVPSVLAAARGGAFVNWWAGGRLSVPLRVRLARRSVALVRFIARRRSALVCFLASPSSRGSLLACRVAARLGVTVFVFCVGFSPSQLPRLGRGSWSAVQVAGLPACQWQSQSLKKQMKDFYESITYSKYNFRKRRTVRRLQDDAASILLLCLLAVSLLIAFAIPVRQNDIQQQPSTRVQQQEIQFSQRYDIPNQFDDESESLLCLQWLNTSQQSTIRSALMKENIQSFRIDTILKHRPYKTWSEVNDLPQVGITTIDNTIKAWRKEK
jgi:hypothetical protein